jgi:hypothetical protein
LKNFVEEIKDKKLRKAVELMLKDWEYKLKFIPGSMTGVHHAKDERIKGGLSRHIEKVCWFITKSAEAFKLSDEDKDILLVCAYFHDISKVRDTRVLEKLIYWGKKILRKVEVAREVKDGDKHPFESANMARNYLAKAEVDTCTVGIIVNIIICHMNHWYPRYPLPKTEREKMFALADYIVSREEFDVKEKSCLKERLRKSFCKAKGYP